MMSRVCVGETDHSGGESECIMLKCVCVSVQTGNGPGRSSRLPDAAN